MSLISERGRWHLVTESEVPEPFLMTIVGASDHWMFISSTGALTAGRCNAQQAIFSYETEDRLHMRAGEVGPVTAFRITQQDRDETVWRPFDPHNHEGRTRTLAKRTLGDGLRFSETHHDTGLEFSYEWAASDEFGFVRTCSVKAPHDGPDFKVRMVDGFRAVLPHGVDAQTQQTASVLVDAYKHSEIVDGGVGVYSLTARIVDRPEPAEALRCTVAYQHGLDPTATFLDDAQFQAFIDDGATPRHTELRLGRPANYYVANSAELEAGGSLEWITGVDIGWDAAQVIALQESLERPNLPAEIDASIEHNRRELLEIVARADGLQTTASAIHDDRHATNVMFNCMRGGIIASEDLPGDDVRDFFAVRNRRVASEFGSQLRDLGESFPRAELLDLARDSGDADFLRLATEYMPLTFSRRHGDPSRPWNAFNIRVRHEDGSPRYYFEGNWRDVFQNWEALLMSFPEYAESAWTVFFNATTPDGHNPYRITRDGIDWERPDPDDPWAHIGYWGDHQIIYSLKLLELCEAHHPGLLAERLHQKNYVFADVPYRIFGYDAIVADPHETIAFDVQHDRAIDRRREAVGGDGNLLHSDREPVRANLAEKLLLSALAKLSNFVADGGIWMNTQRPEWNDANNALVGNGLSMVTLAYLVRHLRFLYDLFADEDGPVELHEPVAQWLRDTADAFDSHPVEANMSPTARRALLDSLGRAAETYREEVYTNGMGDFSEVSASSVSDLLATARTALETTLDNAHRSDGLFHGYNLLELRDGEARVDHLPLMLEGQVAGLSAGNSEPSAVLKIAEDLFDSPLYRANQNTFLLYPAQTLPRFLERGVIEPSVVRDNALLQAMAEDETVNVVRRDAEGVYRFSGGLKNAKDLDAALERLGTRPEYEALVAEHRDAVLEDWEKVFDHRSYTGRSGSMYGYEGLGSIYWHMVSKLNLAIQESFLDAAEDDAVDDDLLERLGAAYYRHRAGLGDAKTFTEYGAFPTDAYSHTPPNGGARQPGMTGQVKEDILTRRGELGVTVEGGCLRFAPALLRASEFVDTPTEFSGISLDGREHTISLAEGNIAFTVCQVPVVYSLQAGSGVDVSLVGKGGNEVHFDGDRLDSDWSREVFGRTGKVRRIDVAVGRDELLS